MTTVDVFSETHLEQICDVLADTSSGLTGAEIGRFLANLGVDDPMPSMAKRHRLYEALLARQQKDRSGNIVAAFIHRAMDPARYTESAGSFESKRQKLNHVLAFAGYSLGEDGKLRRVAAARTLNEAEQRAGRLKAELGRRGVHPDVLAFCRSELLQQNYFHAVFEATKSVAEKIRNRSGLTGDGALLINHAFGMGKFGMPFLAFNTLQTETEQSEHSGMMNLMKGMFGAFRNVMAHAPKVSWPIKEEDALDLLTIASFLHRRLDTAVRTPRHS
ncbi:MAG: TIGR02391 family protein [Phycisphaerales bacterium]|nr:TIGR02391 family protein [Phycisphaerales bacterium]